MQSKSRTEWGIPYSTHRKGPIRVSRSFPKTSLIQTLAIDHILTIYIEHKVIHQEESQSVSQSDSMEKGIEREESIEREE